MKKPFDEELYSKFYQIFHTLGFSLSVPQMDQLRDRTTELAKLISKESTVRAMEFLDKIKEEFLNAVKELDQKVQKLEEDNINYLDRPIKNSDN